MKRLENMKQNKSIFSATKQAMLDRNIEPHADNVTMGVYQISGFYKGMIIDGAGNSKAEALAKIIDAADRQDALGGVMTAAEVVDEFGLSEATVRQAINRGQIYARKSGGTWIMRRADAEAKWGKK